ncbi:MAG TPA: hypothetical protein VLK33_19935 [Terriglobales bacterium]|nr:hypothetical protein [Terriglobales bacterium]
MIEWTGRPNPAIIFHSEDWGFIPFSLLWGGFAIFWLVGASGIGDIWVNKPNQTFEYFGLIWGTPFVLVGQYMIWGRFVYEWWKKKRTYYALTNRRALIVVDGIRSKSSTSAYFEHLSLVDKQVRSDGNGRISFGGPVTGHFQWGKNNPPRPLTFDDVDDADSIFQIVARLHDKARSSPSVTSSQW